MAQSTLYLHAGEETDITNWSAGTLATEQQTPVSIEDITTWSAGTLVVTDDGAFSIGSLPEPLDVSGATVPTEQQTPVAIEDTTGAQVDPASSGDVTKKKEADGAFENATAVASGASTSQTLHAVGGDTLRGRVVRATTAYDVTVDWLDDAGNVIFSDAIASGVTAGTETTINEPAISGHATVTVADAGAGSGDVDATYHMR